VSMSVRVCVCVGVSRLSLNLTSLSLSLKRICSSTTGDHRDGDPISDAYSCDVYSNRSILAVADGHGFGKVSRSFGRCVCVCVDVCACFCVCVCVCVYVCV
jgi:hypothetical protein